MPIRKIIFFCLMLLISFGAIDVFAGKKSYITGVDPNTLIQEITGEEIFVARRGSIRGTHDNPIIDPNNLIRDAVSCHEIILGRITGVQSGLRFILLENNIKLGRLQIGVYANNKFAVEKYKEVLLCASVGPDKDLSTELGDKARGWTTQRIDFVRDNVFVSVGLSLKSLASNDVSKDFILTMAKEIDKALIRGTHGVDRASDFRMPRFLELKISKNILPGKHIEAKIHIALPLGVNGNSEIEIIKSLTIPAPRTKSENSKNVTYEITYITPNCVVISKQIELKVGEKEDKK